MSNRTDIPSDVAEEVLFCSDRTCCVCRSKGKSVQIHHIDGCNTNHAFENLAVLCLECHNDTLQKGGFDRKLSPGQVALYHQEWLGIVGRILTSAQMAVLEAIDQSRYPPRKFTPIAAQCGLSASTVKSTIEFLLSRGMLSQSEIEEDGPFWSITPKGRSVIEGKLTRGSS